MKIIWATDVHLNLVNSAVLDAFCRKIVHLKPDAVLIGGDIGDSKCLVKLLLRLEEKIQCKIFFVLGNHDYYRGSIGDVRNQILEVTKGSSYLNYLSNMGIVKLTSDTALIGHDSWADGCAGDYFNSHIRLNDYTMIEDLRNLGKETLFKKLNALGTEAALFFHEKLTQALPNFQHILILTHVPPVPESCWHEGDLSNKYFLPHFCCQAVGEVFIELMTKNPSKNLMVICGHTHSSGVAHILPNLLVKSGGAIYGQPDIQDPIFIKEEAQDQVK